MNTHYTVHITQYMKIPHISWFANTSMAQTRGGHTGQRDVKVWLCKLGNWFGHGRIVIVAIVIMALLLYYGGLLLQLWVHHQKVITIIVVYYYYCYGLYRQRKGKRGILGQNIIHCCLLLFLMIFFVPCRWCFMCGVFGCFWDIFAQHFHLIYWICDRMKAGLIVCCCVFRLFHTRFVNSANINVLWRFGWCMLCLNETKTILWTHCDANQLQSIALSYSDFRFRLLYAVLSVAVDHFMEEHLPLKIFLDFNRMDNDLYEKKIQKQETEVLMAYTQISTM